MEPITQLPKHLQDLVDAGRVEKVDEGEYSIPALFHQERAWHGWQDTWYTLTVGKYEDPDGLYEISEESRESGGDSILVTSDPEEVSAWIIEMIESKD